MANPANTARSTPGGIVMPDGYQMLIAFERDPDVSFWEKSGSPPGIDGGDAIDVTTMHNTTWRTFRARSLLTLAEFTIRAAYDPNVYQNILDNLVNQEGSITFQWYDGTDLDFYGYLRQFTPAALEEGSQPEADVVITPTNYDPTNDVEQGFVLTNVSGT